MEEDSEVQASESREGKARVMLVNLIPTKDKAHAHLGRHTLEGLKSPLQGWGYGSVGRVLV